MACSIVQGTLEFVDQPMRRIERRASQYLLVRLGRPASGGQRAGRPPVRRQEAVLDVLDGLLPCGSRPDEATVVGDTQAALRVDHAIEGRQDAFAVHPVE